MEPNTLLALAEAIADALWEMVPKLSGVPPTKQQEDCIVEQLRRRLTFGIAQICLLLEHGDLLRVADYVLTIGRCAHE